MKPKKELKKNMREMAKYMLPKKLPKDTYRFYADTLILIAKHYHKKKK